LRARFEEWRAVRTTRRIPESLWERAVELARELGVHRTARALRLNYHSLAERAAELSMASARATVEDPPAFVELPVIAEAQGSAELESPDGARLRLEWRGACPDLAALCASFFGDSA
jgi:hypothetical protein